MSREDICAGKWDTEDSLGFWNIENNVQIRGPNLLINFAIPEITVEK